MPIEFRCVRCNKLLRTGDDTAGKQAKCPECGTVMPIPMPGAGPSPPYEPMGRLEAVGSPFGSAAAAVPPDSMNPYQSPAGLEAGPLAFAPAGQIRPTRIVFGEVFSRTWAVFVDRWLYVLGAAAILFLIGLALSGTMQVLFVVLGAAVRDPMVIGVTTFFCQAIMIVVQAWLQIGMLMFLLSITRGEEPRFGLLFAGGPYLLPVILCGLLMTLIIIGPAGAVAGVSLLAGVSPWIALACFVAVLLVPGIIPIAYMLMHAPMLIIDHNMGVIGAMSASRQVMAGNKLTVFLIYLVAIVVAILIGLVTCLVGLIAFQYLYAPILYIVIYLGVTGQPTMLDRYAFAPEEAGRSPFGQPGAAPLGQIPPASPPGNSPFMS